MTISNSLNPQRNLPVIIICLHLSILATLGLYANDPAHSCKEIRDVGDSKKDGKYWIDPEKNGNPLNVYCDMTTDGGKVIKGAVESLKINKLRYFKENDD